MSSTHLPEGSLAPNSKFCHTLLNFHKDLEALTADAELLDLALRIRDSKKAFYTNVATLLNYISKKIHDQICKKSDPVVFRMYDILEAHRFMFLERKLLHRDISHGNIIVHAQDSGNIRPFRGKKRPVYINEILQGKARADPMARLIDMDNCAYLGMTDAMVEEEDTDDKPLQYRTGTPKFISRSVALGAILQNFEFVFSARKRATSTGREESEAKRQHRMNAKGLEGSTSPASGMPSLSLFSAR
ncbi:hypothetical protein AB1N83_013306 [Pleurotus pulmonarius]